MPNDTKPLSDSERDELSARASSVICHRRDTATPFALERWRDIERYEATVRERDRRIAELEEALDLGIKGLSVIELPHAEHVAERMRRTLAAEGPTDAA